MEENKRPILQFAPFQSAVDEGFWHRLSSLKLNELGIDDSPIPVSGFFAPCSHYQVSNHLTLISESLPSEESSSSTTSHGNRNRCPVPGMLYNTNTLEAYRGLDKEALLKAESKKIWDDIHSGRAVEDSTLLSRFFLISYADLKKWSFHYWFAFPALVLEPAATLNYIQPASQYFSSKEAESLSAACNDWRKSTVTADVPFFLVYVKSDSSVSVRLLKDWDLCQDDCQQLLFGFYDPCHLPNNPGWPLRNFLCLIAVHWKINNIRFLCYRENRGFADLGLCLVGEAVITVPEAWKDHGFIPATVGWESIKGKKGARCISLAKTMDPRRLAVSAADLNLKLMRWRALPSLDLDILFSTKCLLLGAGTLGCQVARMLMAWGVRKITLVDNGRVAMSNPLRQSLYTLEDCLNGGEYKAVAAVKSLKLIFPAVEAEGVVMSIPMPGHPISSQEEESVINDCRHLHDLVNSHDVVFLLTDTRESRWLPTIFCATSDKITITAALGFDSFLVMRHGSGPFGLSSSLSNLSLSESNGRQRLGCYFCNDVVAPIDSTANRTLDQQCTVTRPGLAPIASALAVELLVGILHHPDRAYAEAEHANTGLNAHSERPLGILPHQIRGSFPQFSQITLTGYCSKSCTACSGTVVSEYRNRGMEFVLQAINHPTYLEDLTGLTELMKSANSFDLDWDSSSDRMDDEDECLDI
ncbi:hypothetical protein SAY86_030618 [Trapa natans]|uniref:Ubiquitin-like modifier-activating enzyme ATG7 n=1 Tax=Trapa natans TaxID=22666 RepID=A0AAN7MGA3_TRANT|nr:hypothetical protein SAY86_030618 [Trapa natans]